MAFDGDRATGWAPGRAVTGEWLQARFLEPRRVSEVVVEQRADAPGWISEAEISGRRPGRRDGRGSRGRRVVVPVPTSEASTVRIRVTEHQGDGLPSLSEVGIAGAPMTSRPARAARRCVTLGTVDGAPLRARIVGGVEGDGPRTFQGCDPLELGGGEHRAAQRRRLDDRHAGAARHATASSPSPARRGRRSRSTGGRPRPTG